MSNQKLVIRGTMTGSPSWRSPPPPPLGGVGAWWRRWGSIHLLWSHVGALCREWVWDRWDQWWGEQSTRVPQYVRRHSKEPSNAATRLKKKSILTRLSLPNYHQNGWLGYPSSGTAKSRWGSTDSLGPRNERWTGQRVGTRGWYMGRGRCWLGRRIGWRGVARRGGAGQRRGGTRRPPPPTREQLDQELDVYMAGTKTVLDNYWKGLSA